MDQSQEIRQYLAAFASFEKRLNGTASPVIHSVRKAALARFAELGFPTTRDEEWKYTDITPLVKSAFTPVVALQPDEMTAADIGRFPFGTSGGNRLVFIHGHFSEKLSTCRSLPKAIGVGSLASALRHQPDVILQHLTRYARYDRNAFCALNTAFLLDGAFVHIPENIVLDEPLHLMFVSSDLDSEFVVHPRNLILVGKNSQATLLETYVHSTAKPYFTNVVSEIVLAENSVFEHEKIQIEGDRAFHMAAIHVHQGRNSNYISNSISFGGSLVRNNIYAVLDGEGTEATLNGLYIGTDDQVIDNHTAIDHAKPHCTSHELYKGILDGKSRGVFNGKILVRKDAQKTDAKQTNKNLILSEYATVDTKPQLEIFANDVRCTHGATIGQLDDDALFYLRARGITADMARDMLIYAFASDVVDRIRMEQVRQELQNILHDRLQRARFGRT